jgi:hypothetical protein
MKNFEHEMKESSGQVSKSGGLETDGHFLAGLENRRAVQTKCGRKIINEKL